MSSLDIQILTNLPAEIVNDYCSLDKSGECRDSELWINRSEKDFNIELSQPTTFEHYEDILNSESTLNAHINSEELDLYVINENIEVLKNFMIYDPNFFDNIFYSAVKNNKVDVVSWLFSNFEYDSSIINDGLLLAAEYGNLEIFKYFITFPYDDINHALIKASEMGKLNIVRYIIDIYTTETYSNPQPLDLDNALITSATNKHEDIVDYLINDGYNTIGKRLKGDVYDNAVYILNL